MELIMLSAMIGFACGLVRTLLRRVEKLKSAADMLAFISFILSFILSLVPSLFYATNILAPQFIQDAFTLLFALINAIISLVCEELTHAITEAIMHAISEIFESLTSYW